MNKIFKVIWSHATQTFVVVSELTRSKSKAKASVSDVKKNGASSLVTSGFKLSAISALLISFTSIAEAAVSIGSTNWNSMQQGTANNNNGQNAIVIGDNAGNQRPNDYVGEPSPSGDYEDTKRNKYNKQTLVAGANANNTVALGTYAYAMGHDSIAIGTNSQAVHDIQTDRPLYNSRNSVNAGAVAIGFQAVSRGDQTIALGSRTGAYNRQATAIGNDSYAMGVGSVVVGGDDSSYTPDNAVLSNGSGYIVAGGFNPSVEPNASWYRPSAASGNGATVVGVHSQALSKGSTALGVAATAGDGGQSSNTLENGQAKGIDSSKNIEATAVGALAHAKFRNTTAVGHAAHAIGEYSTSIGDDAKANGKNSSAIGKSATANGDFSVAIGNAESAKVADTKAEANGTRSIAVGTTARTSADDSIAVGTKTESTAGGAISVGYEAKSKALDAIAIGTTAKALTGTAIAIGLGATSSVDGGVALGANSISDRSMTVDATKKPFIPATATQEQEKAINDTVATTGAVSLGKDGVRRQITNLAAGAEDSDAVNVAQLKAAVTKAVASSTWNIQENTTQKEVVNSGDDVNFADGIGTTATVDVNKNASTSTSTSTVKFSVNQSDLNVANNGSVTAVTKGDYFATAEQVAKAINDSEKTTVINSSKTITAKPTVNGTVTTYDLDLSEGTKKDIEKGVDAHTTVTNKGITFTADSGTETLRKLGDTLAINGDKALIDTTVETGKVSVAATKKLQDAVASAESALQEIETTANGVKAQTIKKDSNKANFTNGKNIKLTPSTTGIEVATKDDVTFTTVNATTCKW
ncbi:ESPR-type extended signal peptide-containing protein [Actinobacillus pleuropneumoniae]|uniref:ESPR-type extended signal peptide-containing protein n=1 Tax=Actinobacillus pleuropneumoniae TaxID=715 RepID=UPI003B9849DE